jgi:hypothetical protein
VLGFFARIAFSRVDLSDGLLICCVDKLVKPDRDKTLFAVDLDWIGGRAYADWTCSRANLLCLFLEPGFETRSMEKMSAKSSDIDVVVQTDGTLIPGVDQVRANLINVVFLNVNLGPSLSIVVLLGLLLSAFFVDKDDQEDDYDKTRYYDEEKDNDDHNIVLDGLRSLLL